jgi:ribosomal protein S18 acetylase RimI-like enzyme
MKNLQIRPYQPTDERDVIQIWQSCKLITPANNPQRDIARKMRVHPELFLIATIDEQVIGTCMVGYEGHRGWINYLAVAPEYQRQGIASHLMAAAEARLKALGCPKINLQVRSTNTDVIKFYESVGYAVDDVVSMGKRLTQDPVYEEHNDST